MDEAISVLQREPGRDELGTFVAQARERGVEACRVADVDGITWDVDDESIDHFEGGMTVMHRVYVFAQEGCESAEIRVELQLGG